MVIFPLSLSESSFENRPKSSGEFKIIDFIQNYRDLPTRDQNYRDLISNVSQIVSFQFLHRKTTFFNDEG